MYIKLIPDLCEIQGAHLQLILFNSSYQITLHHIMHTNHPIYQQPAHTHSALATLVFLKSILSSSKTLWRQIKTKTNLTTAYLLKNDGWLNCGLIEWIPPPSRGYWKIKPNHNTMKPWRPGEVVVEHKNYKTLDIFIWDSLTLNIRECCYTERFDSSERGQPSVKYRLVYT